MPPRLRWPFADQRYVVSLPLLAALVVSLPLLWAPGAVLGPDTFRSYDWLESAKLDAFARISLLRWGSLPHWNPYLQGGFPQLAHPSDGSLSPLMLPVLLLGEELGMKLNVILALALGALGTALLGRDRLQLRPPHAAFAGCLFAVAGWVPSRLAVGYYESTLYCLFPLVAWLFLQSAGRPWRLLGATALLAVCALQLQLGLPVLMLALSLWTFAEVLRRALPLSHLLRLLLLCAGGVGLGAIKLLPMWSSLSRQGFRSESGWTHDAFYVSLNHLLNNLWDVVPAMGSYDARGANWNLEYGYVGLGMPALLLLGYALLRVFAIPWGQRLAAALLLLTVWVCFGHHAPVNLFQQLWSLPIFHSMRGALRYISFVLLWFGCLLAAGGLQTAARGIGKYPLPRLAVTALVVLTLAWPAACSLWQNSGRFTRQAPLPAAAWDRFRQEAMRGDEFGLHRGGGPDRDLGNMLSYINLKAGIGTVYVPGDFKTRPAAQGWRTYDVTTRSYHKTPGYRGEAWCQDHDCEARVVQVQAGLLRVRLHARRAGWLVLNQNFHPQWEANSWQPKSCGGLVCTPVSAGPQTVTFRFQPELFQRGLMISLATLALGLLGAWLAGRRARRAPG